MGEIFADRCCNGNVSGCFIVYLQLNFIGNKSPVVLLGGIVFDRNRGFLIFSQGRRTDTYRQKGMFSDYGPNGFRVTLPRIVNDTTELEALELTVMLLTKAPGRLRGSKATLMLPV